MDKPVSERNNSKRNRYLTLFTLILAGETIFFLPFVLQRVFRPTFLAVFDVNNIQLGTAFTIYGVTAMISYFFGGLLADRFSARRLMSIALIATGIGGFYLATKPGILGFNILYAYWGVTSILLFWSAMIRATREWGGKSLQGKAFGFLDGGRGMAAAMIGSLSVWIFTIFLTDSITQSTASDKSTAFINVVYFVSSFVIAVAILAWFTLKDRKYQSSAHHNTFHRLDHLIKIPAIWYISIIILCAYSGYKITDDFSLLASEVLGMDEVASANVGNFTLWTRVLVAFSAGILADKLMGTKVIIFSFLLMLIGSIAIGFNLIPIIYWFYILILGITAVGIFAVRALYFAVMQEGNIPLQYTGTAAGIISVVGFTPEIFMGPLMGYFLDVYEPPIGHFYVFRILAIFSFIGLIASVLFHRNSAVK